jgi:hypothetical protein
MSSISTARGIDLRPAGAAARRGLHPAPGWLSSVRFDLLFVVVTASVALTAAISSDIEPSLFGAILVADLWLLGYHHVIATFTRLTFDTESFQRYRWLVTKLPFAVGAGVLALALGVGAWTLPTLYLYWQWWHYTRQSYGVAQMYRLKSPQSRDNGWEMKAALYLLPLTGILYRSYQSPEEFLGMDLRVLPVPLEGVLLAGAAAGVALAWWVAKQFGAWRRGELPLAFNLYMLSHTAVFGVGYLAIPDIDHGWLAINIWHNAQYMLVVWMFNRNRFKGGVDPEHRWLSTLSQPRNVAKYFGVTLGLTLIAYVSLSGVLATLPGSTLVLALILYQTINFHHYIVDSVIWKVRKPQIRTTLGLDSLAA